MNPPLLAHLSKDARILVRNRALLVALLVYPFLLAAVLGAAFQQPPTRLSLVVVNDDPVSDSLQVGNVTLTSRDIVAAATEYADVRVLATEAAGLAEVRQGGADALLLIPRGFVGDLARLGGNATLHVVVDESDPVRAGVARSAVLGGVDAFVRQIVERKIEDVQRLLDLTLHGGTTRVAFVDVNVLGIERARADLADVLGTLDPASAEAQRVRGVITFLDFAGGVLGNSHAILTTTALPVDTKLSGLASAGETRLLAVALPGALVLTLFWTGALSGALLVARERETGAARRLAAAPGRGVAPIVSKLLVALAAALVPAAALLAVATLTLGGIVRDPALTALALFLGALSGGALGILAAGIARRGANGAALLAVLFLVPMLLLGGLFYPVAYMPPPARAVAQVLPVTLATDALRGAMLRGNDIRELAGALVGLAAVALVAAGVGVALARRGRA